MSTIEVFAVWLAGGLSYCGIELLWQGRSHWTMLVLGGLCFLAIYGINIRLRLPPPLRWLLCAGAVTGMEFISGCLLNLWLRWDIWSYRNMPGNVLGQVCPLYAFFWFLLSIPGAGLSRFLYRCFHGNGKQGAYPAAASPLAAESSTTSPSGTAQPRIPREES